MKLIEKLEEEKREAYSVGSDEYGDGKKEGLEIAIEIVKNHSDWIPVSESLPELDYEGYSDEILVTDKWDEVTEANLEKSIFLKSEGKLIWRGNGITYNFDEITAWMPKPKPYKK